MTFISFSFYIFLSIVVLAYYLVPQKVRWITLLAGSLFFYFYVSAYSPLRLSVLVLAALLCWVLGLLQQKVPGGGGRCGLRFPWRSRRCRSWSSRRSRFSFPGPT